MLLIGGAFCDPIIAFTLTDDWDIGFTIGFLNFPGFFAFSVMNPISAQRTGIAGTE